MQEIMVLGSGNAFCIDGRGHTSFLLDQKLLIDCGATTLYKIQEMKVDLNHLKAILITHFHGDHFAGMPFVLIYLKYILNRKEKLILVGHEGFKENYQILMSVTYPEMEFPFDIEIIELNKSDGFVLDHYVIQSFPITHKSESIGYRIVDDFHRFAFTGDTILNQEVLDLMDGVDVGIMELSLWENPNQMVSHVSLQEVIQHRDKIKAKKLYFNHITNALAEEVQKLNKDYPNFGLPLYDGMKIYF